MGNNFPIFYEIFLDVSRLEFSPKVCEKLIGNYDKTITAQYVFLCYNNIKERGENEKIS